MEAQDRPQPGTKPSTNRVRPGKGDVKFFSIQKLKEIRHELYRSSKKKEIKRVLTKMKRKKDLMSFFQRKGRKSEPEGHGESREHAEREQEDLSIGETESEGIVEQEDISKSREDPPVQPVMNMDPRTLMGDRRRSFKAA